MNYRTLKKVFAHIVSISPGYVEDLLYSAALCTKEKFWKIKSKKL